MIAHFTRRAVDQIERAEGYARDGNHAAARNLLVRAGRNIERARQDADRRASVDPRLHALASDLTAEFERNVLDGDPLRRLGGLL